ncbi:hypothetical protein niasHT_029179 [Heterodera trifolii]|uniref:Secreted protein n=1 Tax=Heterodera trifolii TaxID=157864 RepID=A0ABD2JG87_9BILA
MPKAGNCGIQHDISIGHQLLLLRFRFVLHFHLRRVVALFCPLFHALQAQAMRRLLDRSTDSVQILYTEGELDKTDLGQPPSRLGWITSNSITRIDVRLGNCCSVSSISVPTNCAWQLVKEQRLIQFGVGRPIQIFWQRPRVGRRCVALVFPSVEPDTN